MNNYIKKCLIVYISLATILFGMVGVTYAITASDADQYVTRSQYAVDMAYLQNKLDEAEAGILGNINKYRATNVKLVTYSTPDKGSTLSGYENEYRGGNLGFSYAVGANGKNKYAYTRGTSQGYKTTYDLHRLWNGNYILMQDFQYNYDGTEQYGTQLSAVPIENLPGYYIVFSKYSVRNTGVVQHFSIEKLDRTAPKKTATEINDMALKIRLKKDLWGYAGSNVRTLSTTPSARTVSLRKRVGNHPTCPLSGFFSYTNTPAGNDVSVSENSYIDSVTGDYIVELKGIAPTASISDTMVFYYDEPGRSVLSSFTPLDNVEYAMTSQVFYNDTDTSKQDTLSFIPFCVTNGDGTGVDKYWEYEFVDCENGIKYFHARKKPATDGVGYAVAWNYCIPIVY